MREPVPLDVHRARMRYEEQKKQPHKRYLLFDTTEHFATGLGQIVKSFDTIEELVEDHRCALKYERTHECYDRIEGVEINLWEKYGIK